MPLPSPNSGETQSHFIDRCMANPTMNNEYPDSSQRRAVCQSQWDRRNRTVPEPVVLLEREEWHKRATDELICREPMRKGFVADKIGSLDKEERSFEIVISTPAIDRDHDTISVKGWDLKGFRRNPVIQWAHNHRIPAIAVSQRTVRDGDQLIGQPKFPAEGVHPLADTIFNLFAAKILRAASVGMLPIEYEWDEERRGYDFMKQELLEFSLCNVPANPEALIRAKALGIDVAPLREWAMAVLEGEEPGLWIPKSSLERVIKIADDERVTVPAPEIHFVDPNDNNITVVHHAEEEEEPNIEGIVVLDVSICDRCGKQHEEVAFMPLTGSEVHTHWANCPETNEPILLTVEEEKTTENDPIEQASGGELVLALLDGEPSPGIDQDWLQQVRDVVLGPVKEHTKEAVHQAMIARTGKLD